MPADIGSVDIVRCLPVLVRMFCLVPRLTHSLVTMASKGQTEKGDGAGKRMRGDKLVCACRWLSCAHCSWLWCVSCRLLAAVAGRQACIARGFGAYRAGIWLLSLAGMCEVMSYGVTKARPMSRHAEKFERVAHHQCEKNEGTGQTSLCTSATNHASFIRFSRFSALTLHIIYNVNNKTCH